jgi:hypothetical protein
MNKMLIICPHLSTGGAPQFSLNKIELLKEHYDIWCIEYSFLSPDFVVQRNKIIEILGDKFIPLYDNKEKLIDLINDIKPDIISFEEIAETFMDSKITESIYKKDRSYKILESTHSSHDNSNLKQWLPDKFIFVSPWSQKMYSHFGVESEVIEYPVDIKLRNKLESQKKLGLDPNVKHIVNIGLFTPGKNQGYAFEIARKLLGEKVLFHFIGNQAGNFQDYWEPIMKNKPENCIIWGERSDADEFIKASDLFLFTSKFELNPLVVKEALCYKDLPIMMFNLETYMNKYDNVNNIIYLSDDLEFDYLFISKKLKGNELSKNSITIVTTHDNEYRKKLLENCLENIKSEVIVSSNYPVDCNIQKKCDWLIYSKENPLLYNYEFKKFDVSYNYWYIKDGIRYEKPFDYEHGYAAYKLIKNGLDMAKNLKKDIAHIINYDYEIYQPTILKNEELLKSYDIVFYNYDNDSYDEKSYSTGFISGKIDALIPFFNEFKSKKEYYTKGEGFNILEKKVFNFYKNKNFKIKEISYHLLESDNKTNQEGVLYFSNNKEIKKVNE